MRRILIAVLLAACGGSDGSGLNPAMAGTWVGTTTLTLPGVAPQTSSGFLVISVSGNQGTVSSICPDGSGSVSASGSGDSLLWSGSYQCPPVAFSDCAAVTFVFKSANVHVSSGPYTSSSVLTAQGSADGSGCGVAKAATFSFTGSRQ